MDEQYAEDIEQAYREYYEQTVKYADDVYPEAPNLRLVAMEAEWELYARNLVNGGCD